MSDPGTRALLDRLSDAVAADGTWPCGLYVHIPYCTSKCPYCDFNSYALGSRAVPDDTVDAILDEASGWARLAAHACSAFQTVFMGGGTPTTLSARQLRRLVQGLRDRLPLAQVTEFTVEANPGTITPEKADALVDLGINRASVGVQSLDPAELQTLGRTHGVSQVHDTFRLLRERGLANLSADLMFAVPGQTAGSFRRTIEGSLALGVTHLSAYGLTLEEGTAFYRLFREGRLELPPEEVQAGLYELAIDTLGAGGLVQYEISNFARPGFACRHNLNYWRHGEYLGLGPGAHSFWRGFRFSTVRRPDAYVAAVRARRERGGAAAWFVEQVTPAQEMDEWVMLGLRLVEGVDRVEFRRRFGVYPEEAYPGPLWDALREAGLLSQDAPARLALTRRGILVADAVIRAITGQARPGEPQMRIPSESPMNMSETSRLP